MQYDPIEDDPKMRPLIDAADREADADLQDSGLREQMGFCHIFWTTKKNILKEKYGIEWKTPAEMNPETCFD